MTIEINPESPSQAVVNAANATVIAVDARGRKITLKKLNALDRMRLFEVVGPENVKNEAYFGYASLAFHVTDIDGEPIGRPGSKPQLEALVQRLDDDGLNAIANAVALNFIARDEADQKELVKNV